LPTGVDDANTKVFSILVCFNMGCSRWLLTTQQLKPPYVSKRVIMKDYSFKEEQFIHRINNVFSSFLYRISDIEDYLKAKNEERTNDYIVEPIYCIEVDDEETRKLFQSMFEISEYGEKSFFYNSLFVNIYSFYEYSLINFCKYLNEREKFKYGFSSNSYIYAETSIDFLKSKCKIDFGKNKEYDKICNYKRIRDMIIHNQSILPDDKRYLALKRIDGILISVNNILYIKDTSFLKDFLKTVNKFLIEIIDSTKKRVC